MTERILVTGANGFIGRQVCRDLMAAGYSVRAAVRGADRAASVPKGAELHEIGDLSADTRWGAAVNGVAAVVHLAARVHQMHGETPEALEIYRSVNTAATLGLAQAAAEAGARRFVYVSTIKVNGEHNPGRPFRAHDRLDPRDPYAISKREAEEGLQAMPQARLEVAVVRPTLVYGPGVRANFYRLMRLVELGIPLPLGAVDNRRSLVSVWNLSDLVVRLLTHPNAAGRVFLVSDGEDVSTAELLRQIARAMDRSARLWPVPLAALTLLGRLSGRGEEIRRLTESLQVDISETQATLDWTPPLPLTEGIRRTVAWYLEARHVPVQ